MDAIETRETDRFTPLMIFDSDLFPAFAAEFRINYKPIIGLYEGQIEPGFVVNAQFMDLILDSGILQGQKTVLSLRPQEPMFNGFRRVYVIPVIDNGFQLALSGEYIGEWHQVPTEQALRSAAWTCYPQTSTFYVAKMPSVEG